MDDKGTVFQMAETFSHICEMYIEDPVLIILDGHVSHSKNVEPIIFAREYGIVMLSLTPPFAAQPHAT